VHYSSPPRNYHRRDNNPADPDANP
jgi:hypothetical protein